MWVEAQAAGTRRLVEHHPFARLDFPAAPLAGDITYGHRAYCDTGSHTASSTCACSTKTSENKGFKKILPADTRKSGERARVSRYDRNMDPGALQQFEQIINALMSPDNNVRGQAETAFNQAKDKPDLLMGGLITLLRTNQAEQVCTARHRA